ELISRVPGGRSSTSWVMVNPATGSRTKFPYRDALPPLEFDHRAREAIAKADAVHLDGTRYENALKAALLAPGLEATKAKCIEKMTLFGSIGKA
ncbi:MAG: hypothetical protein K5922_03015, partial [Clostridiales bacterium]|nr:hypothetical protein [Clostridiales bacterium]